jgi:hypothetical protein
LDAYEFTWQGECVHGGGRSGMCATGFALRTPAGDSLAGPLTAILAVRQSVAD